MTRMHAVRGDITGMKVDAIVNAANTTLLGGGGVDGAIHRAAGPELLCACKMIGGCPTGEARITPGHRLPAAWVIHTVGPVWTGGRKNEDRLLENCYRNSLALGLARGVKTFAFPSISTGAYRFPFERAAGIAVATVGGFLAQHPEIEKVWFVCFHDEDLVVYRRLLQEKIKSQGPGLK